MSRIHLAIHAGLLGVIVWLIISIKGIGPIEGLEQALEDCRTAIIKVGAEGEKAVAVSSAIAKGEGTSHAQNSAITTTAARGFVERNRLRPQVSCPAGGGTPLSGGAGPAPAVPQLDPGSDPGPVPEVTSEPAAGRVAVAEEDVLICTADFEYSWTAYSTWQRLKAEGLAQPETPAFGLEAQPAQ